MLTLLSLPKFINYSLRCCTSLNQAVEEEQRTYYPVSATQARDPAIETLHGIPYPPISLERNRGDIEQENIHPVHWNNNQVHTAVNLNGVNGIQAIVKRPDDIAQDNVFNVPWKVSIPEDEEYQEDVAWAENFNSDSAWGIDGEVKKLNEEVGKLPLPWQVTA